MQARILFMSKNKFDWWEDRTSNLIIQHETIEWELIFKSDETLLLKKYYLIVIVITRS